LNEQLDLSEYGFDFWHKEPEQPSLVQEIKKKPTYSQNWTSYNLSKTQEKLMFLKILNDVNETVNFKENWKFNGRPPMCISNMIKCCCIKVYCKSASRQITSDLKMIESFGYITQTPHFNSINNYMASPLITKYLEALIQLTAEPLIPVEKYFAIDSTGFSTFNRKRWIDVRLEKRLHKDYKKLHIISGVRSNIIISSKVTNGKVHDSPYLELLLKKSTYFNIRELYGDSAYLSHKNCDLIASIKAIPFLFPKKNTSTKLKGNHNWNSMIKLWFDNEKLFRRHYHRRSNVETTFGMIKAHYLPYVRSRGDIGQINEALCKVICHNIAVLVSSIFEFGIKLPFLQN